MAGAWVDLPDFLSGDWQLVRAINNNRIMVRDRVFIVVQMCFQPINIVNTKILYAIIELPLNLEHKFFNFKSLQLFCFEMLLQYFV